MSDNLELFAEGRYTQRNTLVQHFPERLTLEGRATIHSILFLGRPLLVGYSFGQSLGRPRLLVRRKITWERWVHRFKFGGRLAGDTIRILWTGSDCSTTNTTSESGRTERRARQTNPSDRFQRLRRSNESSRPSLHRADGCAAFDFRYRNDEPHCGWLIVRLAGRPRQIGGRRRAREESLNHILPDLTESRGRGRAGKLYPSRGIRIHRALDPFSGNAEKEHATPRLELTLAGRYENYSDFGHTTNPEFRLSWIPIDSLKFRGSWGRSFRAPTLDNLSDLAENVSSRPRYLTPLTQWIFVRYLRLQGDNPNLKQETATTWTAGLDVVPVVRPRTDGVFDLLLDRLYRADRPAGCRGTVGYPFTGESVGRVITVIRLRRRSMQSAIVPIL